MTQEQQDFLHSKRMSRHHWTPKSRYPDAMSKLGSNIQRNISWLHNEKHNAWHRMFHNFTLFEVIVTLNTVGELLMSNKRKDWNIVFKDRNVYQAKKLLERMLRIKQSQGFDPA